MISLSIAVSLVLAISSLTPSTQVVATQDKVSPLPNVLIVRRAKAGARPRRQAVRAPEGNSGPRPCLREGSIQQLGTLHNLEVFQAALLKATALVGGLVDVAIVPSETDDNGEEVAAVAMWLPPGKKTDFGPITIVRSGLFKMLTGWGLGSVKRLQSEWTPVVEHGKNKAFKARGLDRKDSWQLLVIVVDPRHQGKGLSSMLLKEGLRRASPKPVHLEATSAKSRDIYARFGFEIDEEHWFGVGKVDKLGIKARGENATGFPEWLMTKWNT